MSERAKPHGRRYPWADWLSRKRPVVLIRGEHFDTLPHGFAQTARQAAGRAGKRIKLDVGEDRVILEVL